MPSPVVIVTGSSCTGKTALSSFLHQELRMPLVSKDAIKESLFDTLGCKDRAWSRQLGAATMRLLYDVFEGHLRVGAPVMLEANFKVESATGPMRALAAKYGFSPVQVFCHAPADIVFERFRKRAMDGSRHPGHVDAQNLPEFEKALRETPQIPLPIGGAVIDVDTADFRNVDCAAILVKVRDALAA